MVLNLYFYFIFSIIVEETSLNLYQWDKNYLVEEYIWETIFEISHIDKRTFEGTFFNLSNFFKEFTLYKRYSSIYSLFIPFFLII